MLLLLRQPPNHVRVGVQPLVGNGMDAGHFPTAQLRVFGGGDALLKGLVAQLSYCLLDDHLLLHGHGELLKLGQPRRRSASTTSSTHGRGIELGFIVVEEAFLLRFLFLASSKPRHDNSLFCSRFVPFQRRRPPC